MKKKTILRKTTVAFLATVLVFGTVACGSGRNTSGGTGDADAGDGVTQIVFAYRNSGNWPMTAEDEDGNPIGYDIEILKEVDAKLPDYVFTYVGTSYDDAYVGLEAGNYSAALTNAFWTEERAKKYLIPDNIGATVLTLVVRAENADIKNLEDVSKSGLKLAPLLAGNGMYYVVKTYNEENPDAQVEITTTDDSTFVAGSVEELVAGRYDAIIHTKPQFEASVQAEDGDLHDFLDDISYSEFTLAETYPMFSKNVGEDFIAAFNEALAEVKESGRASEISLEFFGYDLFNYDYN